MKPIHLKNTNFIFFFDKKGIKVGNSFYPHKTWLNFKKKDFQEMAGLESQDIKKNWAYLTHLYETKIKRV